MIVCGVRLRLGGAMRHFVLVFMSVTVRGGISGMPRTVVRRDCDVFGLQRRGVAVTRGFPRRPAIGPEKGHAVISAVATASTHTSLLLW
jgi:hypothetical protein